MALIKDGYFQDTYWASRYWQEDYWLEYGTAVAAAPTPKGDFAQRAKPPLHFIRLIRDYVESMED